MLASTIQFSNNNPHTLHTDDLRPPKGPRPPAGRRETRHNTPTTQAKTRGRGLLSQDPIVHHGPHPPTRTLDFHHHHAHPKGHTLQQVLGEPRPATPTPADQEKEECGHLLVDIPPMSSPHQHHGRALGRGRPPHGGQRLLRKEVIQPHLPVRLPCYDLVPIASPTFDGSLPQGVRPPASGVTNFRDLTGGVYKARERIHRSVADLRLLATPTSWGRVADPNPN